MAAREPVVRPHAGLAAPHELWLDEHRSRGARNTANTKVFTTGRKRHRSMCEREAACGCGIVDGRRAWPTRRTAAEIPEADRGDCCARGSRHTLWPCGT